VLTQTPWINRAVQTAADGSWHFDGVPPDAKEVRVGAWNPQNIKSDTVPMQQFDQHSALWTKAATLTVDSAQGVPVTGIVEGPDGRPLAGAKVAIGKDRTASQVRSPIITDAQGGFSLGVPHGSLLVLTVTADGCAPELVQALVNSDRLRLRIPLTKAHTLIGTVVDEAGRPLSHVDVAIRDWRNLLSNPQFFRTDDAGQFTWREAPGDPVTVEISAAGYVQRQLTMTAGEPVRITLQSE
jgi:hypothetical protein